MVLRRCGSGRGRASCQTRLKQQPTKLTSNCEAQNADETNRREGEAMAAPRSVVFLDWRHALDKVSQRRLLDTLRTLSIPPPCVTPYGSPLLSISPPYGDSPWHLQVAGIRQGCPRFGSTYKRALPRIVCVNLFLPSPLAKSCTQTTHSPLVAPPARSSAVSPSSRSTPPCMDFALT